MDRLNARTSGRAHYKPGKNIIWRIQFSCGKHPIPTDKYVVGESIVWKHYVAAAVAAVGKEVMAATVEERPSGMVITGRCPCSLVVGYNRS